jgi:hypothetical protein
MDVILLMHIVKPQRRESPMYRRLFLDLDGVLLGRGGHFIGLLGEFSVLLN